MTEAIEKTTVPNPSAATDGEQQRAHYRNKAAALFRKAENVQYYGAADYYLAE